MCFSLIPHSISIHSHFHPSSLTLSSLCHSSLPSFLHFLFFPILFIISLFLLLIFTLISFHHITLLVIILTVTSLILFIYSFYSHSMSSLIISSASRSSPRIFIYHSSHIIFISSSFHFIILAFFTFPLIHFTMVLFAISSKLIFTHFIYHSLLFIIPSFFNSYFTSITLITTHHCFSFSFASMFSIHSFPSHSSSQPLLSHSLLSISIPIHHFHSVAISLLTLHS